MTTTGIRLASERSLLAGMISSATSSPSTFPDSDQTRR